MLYKLHQECQSVTSKLSEILCCGKNYSKKMWLCLDFTIVSDPFLILNGFVNAGSLPLHAPWLHQEKIIYFTAKSHSFGIGQTAFKKLYNA